MKWTRYDAAVLRPSRWFPVAALAFTLALPVSGQSPHDIEVARDSDGIRLLVDGEPVMINGVNWDYFPVGTTTSYNFWGQPDDFIRQALDREMSLLQAMGGNAIRVYNGIPPRWVEYIYDNYGIWSIVNHPVGRYGVTLDGAYIPQTDYSDPRVRQLITDEVMALVEEFRGTRGMLMWLLGNENNYGLEWSSAETEDLPEGEQFAVKARYLYDMVGNIIDEMKAADDSRPISFANGDLQYLDIIAEEMPNLDVFGSNVYRGISFRDFFQRVEDAMGIPVMFTEFGADRFNAVTLQEDQLTQARYLIGQWREIYEQSHGKGLVGNSIGGLTFQWTDGWWKFGQTDRLDIQDTNASWAADAYPEDFVAGENNMNEEWWGIVAKGPTDSQGFYQLYPRAAFYALRQVHAFDPYAPGADLAAIRDHFSQVNPVLAELQARGGGGPGGGGGSSPVSVSGLRMVFETYSTGGSNVSTPDNPQPLDTSRPSFRGFDTKESVFVDVQATPTTNLQADLSVNILGSVPNNPIDELFWESPARRRTVEADREDFVVNDFERVRLYQANVSWDERLFRMDGFYRTGHYHWAYEGDFFNLYREANYGPNLDIFQGIAPVGVEFTGKRQLEGVSLAFGPELWWGANPTIMAKAGRRVGPFDATVVFQNDLERRSDVLSSFAVPVPENRKATIHLNTMWRGIEVDLGGIWAGQPLVGREFQVVDDGQVFIDEVKDSDTFGGKIKLTKEGGRLNWYVLGSATGLVADGGYNQTQTFTGYTLMDNGSGNQTQLLAGVAFTQGNWQFAPNVMWQKPLVGPVSADVGGPARPRNIIDDPFSVRVNRETTAAEMIVTYDPTPATWMYTWDSDIQEDSRLAVSGRFTWRRHHTTADAAIGILADGRSTFAFPGATPARDLWETGVRIVSKGSAASGLILNAFYGKAEPNGDDTRLLTRYGGDLRYITGPVRFSAHAKFNDWGPFDYHRDFNLTFPIQLMGDASWSLGLPDWFDAPATRFGIRGTWRSLDEFSNRYCPAFTTVAGEQVCNPLAAGDNGREWEIRTYLMVGT